MALYSLMTSPSSFGTAPLSLKLVQKPLILFSCDSSFFVLRSSRFFPPLLEPYHFPGLVLSSTFCHACEYHRLRLTTIHQFRSHSLPRISRTLSAPYQDLSLPVHSPYQVMTSQMSSSPFFQFFENNVGPVHFPGIFIYLLPFPHLIHR